MGIQSIMLGASHSLVVGAPQARKVPNIIRTVTGLKLGNICRNDQLIVSRAS